MAPRKWAFAREQSRMRALASHRGPRARRKSAALQLRVEHPPHVGAFGRREHQLKSPARGRVAAGLCLAARRGAFRLGFSCPQGRVREAHRLGSVGRRALFDLAVATREGAGARRARTRDGLREDRRQQQRALIAITRRWSAFSDGAPRCAVMWSQYLPRSPRARSRPDSAAEKQTANNSDKGTVMARNEHPPEQLPDDAGVVGGASNDTDGRRASAGRPGRDRSTSHRAWQSPEFSRSTGDDQDPARRAAR